MLLFPVNFSFEGYSAAFSHNAVLLGYRNTLFNTIVGTVINIIMTLLAAYPLSRCVFRFKNVYMFIFVFTMYFGGGLIPTYILMTKLKLINTVWVMLIPGALSVYNMILTRTFIITNIAEEMFEASSMDECTHFWFFLSIVILLSKAIIAVITLFYAVGHWNAYFSALIYLNNPRLQPLQIVLRQVLIVNNLMAAEMADPELAAKAQQMSELLKYALIVVASLPIILMYPFVQKYFIKGIMIGAIKG
jgi:putative aldouronate transport system permease protein